MARLIRVTGARGLALTQGKVYAVKEYTKAQTPQGALSTLPAYARVIDDNGRPVTINSNRFEEVKGND